MTNTTAPKKDTHAEKWLSRICSSALLSYGIALAISGCFVWGNPSGLLSDTPAANQVQFAMWILAPLWLTVFSVSFLLANLRHVWLWLGTANAVLWGVLALIKDTAL